MRTDCHLHGEAEIHQVAGRADVNVLQQDDEFAPRGGEIAVGDVDGDALLALGAQTVGYHLAQDIDRLGFELLEMSTGVIGHRCWRLADDSSRDAERTVSVHRYLACCAAGQTPSPQASFARPPLPPAGEGESA